MSKEIEQQVDGLLDEDVPDDVDWGTEAGQLSHTYKLSEFTAQQILQYSKNKIPPGGFLRAVFENNLFRAFNKADLQNLRDMEGIVRCIFNEVPMGAYGSPEEVSAWLGGQV